MIDLDGDRRLELRREVRRRWLEFDQLQISGGLLAMAVAGAFAGHSAVVPGWIGSALIVGVIVAVGALVAARKDRCPSCEGTVDAITDLYCPGCGELTDAIPHRPAGLQQELEERRELDLDETGHGVVSIDVEEAAT